MRCSECDDRFSLSARNLRRHHAEGLAPRCPFCRHVGKARPPSEDDRPYWLDRFTIEEIRDLAGEIWPSLR